MNPIIRVEGYFPVNDSEGNERKLVGYTYRRKRGRPRK